jgi:hypothetical protein
MDALCPALFVLHVMPLPYVRLAPAALSSSILWADIITNQLLSAILTFVFSLIFFSQIFKKKHKFFKIVPPTGSPTFHAVTGPV